MYDWSTIAMIFGAYSIGVVSGWASIDDIRYALLRRDQRKSDLLRMVERDD